MSRKKKPKAKEHSTTSKPKDVDQLELLDEASAAQLAQNVNAGLQKLRNETVGPKHTAKHNSHKGKIQDTAGSKLSTNAAAGSVAGKKRLANGQYKTSKKLSSDGQPQARTKDLKLLEDIEALGGDKNDIQLIGDISSGSDSEFEAPENPRTNSSYNPSQDKELQGLISKLGTQNFDADDHDEPKSTGREKGQEQLRKKESARSSKRPASPDRPKQQVPKITELPSTSKKSAQKNRGSILDSLVVKPRHDWHAAVLEQIPAVDGELYSLRKDLVDSVYNHAKSLLDRENANYTSKESSADSSRRFMSTIMSSGTLSDKTSALTLVLQESPLHNLKAFDNLLNLAKKRSRAQAVIAVGAIKDLLAQGSILPSDRRLKPFETQPGLISAFRNHNTWTEGNKLPPNLTEAHLVIWAFEDWLKNQYFEFLKIIEVWSVDEVEYARSQAVGYLFELLKEKPEQEANLLRLLVNKLGDSSKKVASKTSYLLLQLQNFHPLMKSIVVKSIESDFIFRPGQSFHAKYYAIITLNQTILSAKESDLADTLLGIYFSLFVGLLKKTEKPEVEEVAVKRVHINRKGEKQGGGAPKGKKALAQEKKDMSKLKDEELTDKMISAILTGVNRALPFSNIESSAFANHLDTLFRISHSSNFNTSIQALVLIQRLIVILKVSEHRFYRTLYESMFDPRLATSSKQMMYLNLLYVAMKSDLNVKRVKAFARRLVQVCNLHQPPFVCGALYLLRRLEETFPSLQTLVTEPSAAVAEEDEIFVDADTDEAENPRQNEDDVSQIDCYDGKKRDPEHSNADRTCMWEILPFSIHFHPSVALFATNHMNQIQTPERPDISTHTLMHFLDKFVYKNAKTKSKRTKGSSIMQPHSSISSGILLSSQQAGMEVPYNSESFWGRKIEDVAADQVFFHTYFSSMGKGKEKQKDDLKVSTESAEQRDTDSEEEDRIWDALVESRPEVEGLDEDEEGFSDMASLSDSEDSDPTKQSEGDNEDDEMQGLDSDDLEDEDASSAGLEFDDEDDAMFDSEDEVDADFGEATGKDVNSSSKTGDEDKEDAKKNKKRKLKHLPTFASVEDYAELLAKEDDEDF